VSQALIDELARALAYPKLRRHIPQANAKALTRWIDGTATKAPNPTVSHRHAHLTLLTTT
jgi:hypothetical protein